MADDDVGEAHGGETPELVGYVLDIADDQSAAREPPVSGGQYWSSYACGIALIGADVDIATDGDSGGTATVRGTAVEVREQLLSRLIGVESGACQPAIAQARGPVDGRRGRGPDPDLHRLWWHGP